MSRKKKTTPPKGPQDPHAEREAGRYERPIASRELILSMLEEPSALSSFSEVADRLALTTDEDLEALRRRLSAMQRDGQIHIDRRGRIGLIDRLELERCRVIGHRDGYGFASPHGVGDDYFLSSREMQRVFDGDEVLIAPAGVDARGRREGRVVEVLEHGVSTLPGRYMEEGGIGFLVPYNTRISQHILIPPARKGGAVPGQMVSARITDYPTSVLGAKGEIEEILGDHLDPGLEIDIAIRAHQIPFEWPEAVLDEAGALHEEPDEADKANRVDLRHLPFVTIDGEDARDFDDAVYCEAEGTGFRLWVAIADVSHYVRPGSALDDEAVNRGNSVYFPERVVPMFPEVLSNGLCSLKPRVDRLAMICEMHIDADGAVTESVFYEGVIHSHARLTYTIVGEVIESGWHTDVDPDRLEDIARLHALYRTLRRARDRRGAIDFETVETRIVFTEQRKIEAIVPVQRNDAHKLIEECMLAANVATAAFLASADLPALYRVHAGPSAERLENLRTFLGELALDLPGGEAPTPTDYQTVLGQIAERDDASVIQTMMLRSLSQAVYQPENEGHFGLHYPAYLHFTSPIRRYPDLLVHRAIRHLIRSRKSVAQVRRVKGAKTLPRDAIYPYQIPDIATLGEHVSMTERRADDATREVEAWLKCEFLSDRLGEVFGGVVVAVTRFGIFVELGDLFIEGLVHISALPGDYYHFDQAHQRLVGEHTRQVFQLGSAVTVQVARVDLDERKIDLEMAGATRPKAGHGTKSRGKSRGKSGDKSRSAGGGRRGDPGTGSGDAAKKAKPGAGTGGKKSDSQQHRDANTKSDKASKPGGSRQGKPGSGKSGKPGKTSKAIKSKAGKIGKKADKGRKSKR